jgi:hypothetical protein
MAQECKGASRDQLQRPNPHRRRGLWVMLLLVGIGGVVAIALAVGPLRGAAPPPSASPLPVRTPGPASIVSESAHLQG